MYARMKTDLHFLSTSLKLKKGEIVEATPVRNKVDGDGYFVNPVDDRWQGASMRVNPSDIKLF